MIDFENYERVTIKSVGNYTQIKNNVSTLDCLKRLAELEDLIEKGKLVPTFFVTKSAYHQWLIGTFSTEVYCYGFDTKEEAKAKLKELMESDENE